MALATIYNKGGTDKMLIPSPRVATTRQFNFGPWTEVRMGFYLDVTTVGSDNTVSTGSEAVTVHGITDAFFMGLRNSSSTAFPLTPGAQFIGVITGNYVTDGPARAFLDYNALGMNILGSQNQRSVVIALDGASVVDGGTYPTFKTPPTWSSPECTQPVVYNALISFRFVVNNAGTGTQSITISFDGANSSGIGSGATPPYTLATLQAQLLAFAYASPVTLQWNSGGAALPLPDCVFLYFPFYNSRMRYSAIELIKIA